MTSNFRKKKRLPAEWEPQSAIQITFPHKNSDWGKYLPEVIDTFIEIVQTITKFQLCLVICNDKMLISNYLKNCKKENLKLFEIPSNDVWARDHGGIAIFENEKRKVLDFTFNGWGGKFAAEKDNLVTQKLFEESLKDIPVFEKLEYLKSHLILEGGSIESDGKGTLLTTSKCLLNPNRNPQFSKTEIEEKLKTYFGLKRILWLNHGELIGDDTDAHIDTLARFCNESTIAYVKCLDRNDPHFEALNLMEKELQAFKTSERNSYNLIPLPMPDPIFDEENNQLPATYCNFLIINEAVLVPIYEVPQDEIALKQLEEVFPKREIIGINCRALIRQGGALHCVTMQFPR